VVLGAAATALGEPSGATGAVGDSRLTTVGLFRRGDLTIGFPARTLAEVARVGAVLPLLQCGPACLGGIDLRGLHVPLLDLPTLAAGKSGAAGKRAVPPTPELAAVLSVAGRMVALGVDKVVGLVRLPVVFDPAAPSGDAPDLTLRTMAIIHGGDLVNVVDPEAFVTHPSVPTVADRRAATLALSRVTRRQMIQFDVGGATLAIPAVDINATLPRRAITRNALSGGVCLGSIELAQGAIPVVSAGGLFGMGLPSGSETSEVIVIPLQSGAPIGLAVDRIVRIAEIDLGRAVEIPRAGDEGLLSARLVDAEGRALFVVDLRALRNDRRLQDLATVMWRNMAGQAAPEGSVTADATEGRAGAAVERRRDRYLVVDAGVPMAIPITSVTRIVPMPRMLIPVMRTDPAVLGLAVIEDEVMPVVTPRGADFPPSEAGRVLIVDTRGARAAVAVRRVLGVVTSSWRARTGGSRPDPAPTLIGAEGGAAGRGSQGLHPIIDIAAEVDAIAMSLPLARRLPPAG
jgi:chemotaxis signal transduction protein